MLSFSIIIPSYNQSRFITETLKNVSELKKLAELKSISIQVILIDNCSDVETASKISEFKEIFDHLIIERDKGQYDAINKGIKLVTGSFWTWLNTDDLIDISGFFQIVEFLTKNPNVDYVYGDVDYINENSERKKSSSSGELSFSKLVNTDASISQPGSFFRTQFTKLVGEMMPYHFAFDYEFILRSLSKNAIVKHVNCNVAFFRYYTDSKSGSRDYRFLKEQLEINKLYGGSFFSRLGIYLRLRIFKRWLLN